MRQGSVGKEPEYRRQQQAATERRENAQRQEQVIGAIVALNARIDSVAAEQTKNRKQAERHEKKKSKRDWFTFAALLAAATAAIITLIVSHSDNRAIIRGAEDTEKRQLRAYVFADELGISEIDSTNGPITWVKIKNGGLTPAYQLRNLGEYTGAVQYPLRRPLPTSLVIRRGVETASVSELGPGSVHNKPRRHKPLTPLEIIWLRTRKLVLYLFGEVRYQDAFGCDRWMRYRGVLGGPVADHFPEMAIAPEGNDTSDETPADCLYKAPQ